MKRIKWFIFFFVLFGSLGYFREFFFVQLNNILFIKYYNRDTALKVADIMQVFQRFSYDGLYYSKYVYTLIWTALFFLANYFALKKLSGHSSLIRILVYAYALLLFLAGASQLYGYVINERLQDDEYTLSRWLMGIAQSPIICLILLASEKLYNKSFKS
jgi:hypothetical protein